MSKMNISLFNLDNSIFVRGLDSYVSDNKNLNMIYMQFLSNNFVQTMHKNITITQLSRKKINNTVFFIFLKYINTLVNLINHYCRCLNKYYYDLSSSSMTKEEERCDLLNMKTNIILSQIVLVEMLYWFKLQPHDILYKAR